MAENRVLIAERRAQEFRDWNRDEIDTNKVAIPPPPKTILDECPQFRVLIIGRTGVGKSTICSRVFGIPDFHNTGVSHYSRGIHNVETEITFPDVNPRIIIHDAPGFEAGSSTVYEDVKKFIAKRKLSTNIADQIHCIWYCIPCSDVSRASQECEEDFFGNLPRIVGKIPVIVVFTKYDIMINLARGQYLGRNFSKIASGQVSEEVMIREIRAMADEKYQPGRRQLEKVIPEIGVGFIRLSNPTPNETDIELEAICPDIGVASLTRLTFDHVENHAIRVLWACAQNNNADLKVASSVRVGLKHFGSNMGISAIPFLPLLGALNFWRTFNHCFDEISRIWKLKDRSGLLKKGSTRRRFLEPIFGIGPFWLFSLHTIDILGPLDANATALSLAKIIAGITLIHDSLFMRELQQKRNGQTITSLSEHDIQQALTGFQTQELREHLMTFLEGSFWLDKAYNKEKVGFTITRGIVSARKNVPREALDDVPRFMPATG